MLDGRAGHRRSGSRRFGSGIDDVGQVVGAGKVGQLLGQGAQPGGVRVPHGGGGGLGHSLGVLTGLVGLAVGEQVDGEQQGAGDRDLEDSGVGGDDDGQLGYVGAVECSHGVGLRGRGVLGESEDLFGGQVAQEGQDREMLPVVGVFAVGEQLRREFAREIGPMGELAVP